MQTKNQIKIVKDHLREKGYISRNYCLSMYISRLSAIIAKLRDEGWSFKAEFEDTGNGKDYKYHLLREPNRNQTLLQEKPMKWICDNCHNFKKFKSNKNKIVHFKSCYKCDNPNPEVDHEVIKRNKKSSSSTNRSTKNVRTDN